ncbi:hypothetical protein RND71_043203 [Anisodus tanguticus]|uniref:C2H2-type domain-containing protein n=1 Tax=Anisodus tanguticus TaxID=243964 RepID=A0AAE1QSW8_9SOLA|nr:hypothetical protein RND71_043203 [Anisodus tanguticus]
MESSNQDDSLNSSIDQEVDQQEQDQYNMGGAGRFYECVFCKRGFNTAQALGGHMNIHRKDKASKKKPSTTDNLFSSSNKHEILNSLSGANLGCYNVGEAQSSYVTHFPAYASTSTNGQIFLNHNRSSSHDDHNVQCLNLFGEDWGMNLSLQFGATVHVIETMEKKCQEDDLDLELRLGHYPR